MSKFIQLARCYFNDKDIEDILGNPRFSQKVLLQVARDRGIILSSDEKREDIIRYLSLQYFDWNGLRSLTARLNREEAEERRATVALENVESVAAVEKAAEKVKADLPGNRETITFTKVGGSLVIKGTYIDLDPTRSKAVQREERHFVVEFAEHKGTVKAEYTHSGKAGEIISKIIDQLKANDGTKNVAIRRISLAGIKDAALRTDFLLKVRSGMPGFRALDVHDLSVDHRFEVVQEAAEAGAADGEQKDNGDDSSNAQQAATAEAAEVKSMVRSAALHGDGLLTNDIYQRLREKGYYIYRITWSAKEVEGQGRVMEFEVGFDDPVKAEGFSYDVKRVLPTDAEKEEGKTQHELLLADRPRVRRILAESAYKALAEVEKAAKEGDAK